LTERIKIAWIYLLAALFVAVSLYFVVERNSYLIFALPLVFGILLLYVYSLDKVLLLISFLVPLSINIGDMDVGLTISLPAEAMLFGILVLFAGKLLYEGNYDRKIAKHPISIAIYLMLAWMIITSFTSEMPLVSVKYFISRLWFIVPAYFFAALVFKRSKNIHRFIWLYIAGLTIVIVYTLIHHAINGFSGKAAHWVMKPFYNDHTAYGAALAIYLILAVSYLFYPGLKKWMRTVVFASVIILVVAIIFSLCRAAWVSIAVSFCVLIAVLLHLKFRWIVTIAAVFILSFFAFQQQILETLEKNDQESSADLVEHIRSISNISSDASNLERINRWQSAIRLFEERPIVGWGPGTYQFVYAPYQLSKEKTIISTNAGDGGNAHSEYIGSMAEMGFPAAIILFILVGVFIYKGLRAYNRAKNKESKLLLLGTTLALISYFVHGFLNNFLDTDKLAIPVWSCMAIITVVDIYFADKQKFDSEEGSKE
jgi:O-antigen ligase